MSSAEPVQESLQTPILKSKVGGFHNNDVAVGNEYEGVRPRTGMPLNRNGFPDLPSDSRLHGWGLGMGLHVGAGVIIILL